MIREHVHKILFSFGAIVVFGGERVFSSLLYWNIHRLSVMHPPRARKENKKKKNEICKERN